MTIGDLLDVDPEVADALAAGVAVVALESNVITHGLEYPRNVEAALAVQNAVRAAGAVPATVAVDAGRILIGLTDNRIERFATGRRIPKVSSRDLGYALASGGPGATTVASSVIAAHAAGIGHFCSAGIGGVHRGAARTMDISSDLIQFARTPIVVVCAGAKNILDLGLTLEYLETQSVPVISYRSDDFPAFYCRSSGFPSPLRIDDPMVLAGAVHRHRQLGSSTAVVVTTPPREQDAVDSEVARVAVEEALLDAERSGVRGKDVTAFVMRRVDTATGGRTSAANQAVLISTAEVAGELAVAAADFERSASTLRKGEPHHV